MASILYNHPYMVTGEIDGPIIGARVKALRKERGWSQRQLALFADVSHGYVNLLEAGKVPRPSISKLQLLAKALKEPVEVLVSEAARPSPGEQDERLIAQLARRFGGAKGDPEILEALLKAFARLSPEEQQSQIDMMEWSAQRKATVKVKASRRVAEESEEYEAQPEDEAL